MIQNIVIIKKKEMNFHPAADWKQMFFFRMALCMNKVSVKLPVI